MEKIESYINFDKEKKVVAINEEKIKEIAKLCENNNNNINNYDSGFLCGLVMIKILSYAKASDVLKLLESIIMIICNKVKVLYKYLSLYAFCLWSERNRDEHMKGLLYLIGGLMKEFGRSALRTDGVDVNNLKYFTENDLKPLFPEDKLKKIDMLLLKDYLMITVVNFITLFLIPYEANEAYSMVDNNYWDEYQGLIIRLKDKNLTEEESKEIPRHIPLSLDGKIYIMLFISDFLFFVYTHLCYIKDEKLCCDYFGLDVLKSFSKYVITASNCNILTFFQANLPYPRFNELIPHKMSYDLKDNLNAFGCFLIFFMLLQDKEVPLFIIKDAYTYTITEQLKIVFKDGKNYGLPNMKEELMLYYIKELKKIKMVNLYNEEFKTILYQTGIKKEELDKLYQ